MGPQREVKLLSSEEKRIDEISRIDKFIEIDYGSIVARGRVVGREETGRN